MRYKGKNIDPYESFYWNTTQKFFRGQLGAGISRCVKTDDSLAIMEEVKIAAMRGRNPENPSERGKSNGKYKQRLEINENGTTNTLTSVQKDNLVIEPTTATTICLNSKVDGKQPSLEHRIYDSGGISTAITTGFHPSIVEPLNPYKDGTCRTIKAQYQQSSRANFVRQDGLGATGVVQIWKESARIPQATAQGDVGIEPMCSVHPISHKFEFNPETSIKPIAPALRATDYKAPHCIYEPRYRIRKLTPRECFRLMGVNDNDIDKIQASGISNSSQYKLAGNSIVVDVLYHIFRKAFVEKDNESQQLTFF